MARASSFLIKHYPAHGNKPYRVWFQGKVHWFKTQEDAQAKVGEWQGKFMRVLSAREVDDYLHCKELMGEERLLTAVRFYLEHVPKTDNTKLLSEVLAEYRLRLSGRPKYLTQKKHHLKRLEEEHGDRKLIEISAPLMEQTLEDFDSDWMHDDFLKHSLQFFKWCVDDKHYLLKNPMESLKKRDPSGSKVFLSLPDVDHVLQVCRKQFPEILVGVGLQLFAGVRTAEVVRLEWKHIRKGAAVMIEEEVSKMGHRRVVDWWPAALDECFPAECPEKGRLVSDYVDKKTELLRVCRESKKDFVWGQNAFRHSYATYGCAFFQTAGRVSLLMGDRDIDVFFNNYREYATKAQGKTYFAKRLPTAP